MNILGQLEISELIGIVEEFPWFAAARKELSLRTGDLADTPLYVADRSILAIQMPESNNKKDISPVKNVLKSDRKESRRQEVRVVGGDYFSQEEYEKAGDVSNRFTGKHNEAPAKATEIKDDNDAFLDFCTETLAGIYAEQGYFDKAKLIYSKLILRYPEKNAYFAALIGKLDANN